MMSGKEQNSNIFPDASGKPNHLTSDEDKYGSFESSRTDSGFISSGILSGEIVSSEIIFEEETNEDEKGASGTTTQQQKQQPFTSACDSGILEEEVDQSKSLMRLDSGICFISENFSSLSLKNPNINNLSCTKEQNILPSNIVVDTKESENEDPWMEYFEQDEDGDTYLHTSIIHGYHEVALALIRLAPTPRLLDTPNDDAQTPLHLATATHQPRIVRWLIAAGARPDPRNIKGESPLHIASRSGDLDCCRAITDPVQSKEREGMALSYTPQTYKKCDLNQWNYEGQTSVHVAAISGHIDVLQHLLRSGADINAREGLSGYTALHYAIEHKHENLATFLLYECTLKPDTVTYGGKSALQLGYPVPSTLEQILRSRGVPSPYSSDEEYDDSDDEEMMYDNKIFVPNLVNASA